MKVGLRHRALIEALARRLPASLRQAITPLFAWLDMLLLDHGVFRLLYLNLHQVSPRLWRSAQPAPHDIARLARAGIRTIINLRGPSRSGARHLEGEACARHGITLIDFIVTTSRDAPKPKALKEAQALFRTIAYPALIHCKSGADRAGFAAALFLVLEEGAGVAEAMGALSWRYGHVRSAKTGILDAFFEAYLEAARARPIGLMDWVEEGYDRAALRRRYQGRRWGDVLIDVILRRE